MKVQKEATVNIKYCLLPQKHHHFIHRTFFVSIANIVPEGSIKFTTRNKNKTVLSNFYD